MKKIKIKALIKQVRGVSYKPEDLHNELNEDSVILLRANNIDDGKINFDDIVYVDKSKVSKEQYLRKGDIVICASSGSKNLVGKAAKVEFDRQCTFGAFCKVVRPNSGEDEYLGIYFQSPIYRRKISELAIGANINNIRNEHIDELDIPVYLAEERIDIIKKIKLIQDIIEQRKQELNVLDDLIKARFVELFGDAVTNPMNWPVKKLKELSVQINSGNTPKGGSENYVTEGIAFFRSQNVWKDRLEMDDIVYIDAETHASMRRSSLKYGDILMTKTGRINTENSSLGRAAIYMGEDDKANVNGHVYFIRLKPEVNNKFILRILVSPEYRDLIRSVCVGGIDKRQLNKEHIEDFPIICPPLGMIDDYVAFVDQIDKSKVLSETHIFYAEKSITPTIPKIFMKGRCIYGNEF